MNSKIYRIALSVICLTLLINGSFAQRATPSAPSTATADRVALHQALLDLTNPWTVMCIAAHPDDEDGTSLIVMRRKYGAHTVSLFSTFGEGGQNAIGPELYEELGAIRARETMAAAEIQGSEPHFLGLKDFGYSKSADEAFRVWGHEEALRRMVLQIRRLRPDVIITNHSATSNDHGHHQATARLELEAFDAAADPKRFPEQLNDDVTIWQVQRLFVRAGRSNQAQANNAPMVTIDPNERDGVRDTVYAEEALRALQQHATQGPWPKTLADMARFRNAADGKLPLIRYALTREAKEAAPLPADSHIFFDGLKLPKSFGADLGMPRINGRSLIEFTDERSKVLEALLGYARTGFRFTNDWSNHHRLSLMRNRIERATAIAARVSLTVSPFVQSVIPGSVANVSIKILNTGSNSVDLLGQCITEVPSLRKPADPAEGGPHSGFMALKALAPGETIERSDPFRIPPQSPINIPLSQHLYEPAALGLQMTTGCSLEIGNAIFNVEAVTRVDVAPPVEIVALSPSPVVRTPAAIRTGPTMGAECIYRDSDFNLRLTNHLNEKFTGALVAGSSTGRKTNSRNVTIAAHETISVVATVSGCLSGIDSKKDDVKAPTVLFTVVGASATKTFARLDVPVVWADARVTPGLRVGYVRGFDYSLPNALSALGVESNELSVDEVKTADLQKYSTVIVDNRVYESRPELIAVNQKLLDYANAGGTLIVFYHKSNEWNPDERRKRPQLAPYKLILGEARITDETAPITFIDAQHPLLNTPNKMGQEDFANWIQERGLYYPKEWDPQFHSLIQSNDPGEQPLRGGLLVADYGRGHYIYSSMVWYRQLRAGVPGAYRMLANMISYGRLPR